MATIVESGNRRLWGWTNCAMWGFFGFYFFSVRGTKTFFFAFAWENSPVQPLPYRLFSARWQLTHCARLNIHKYYLQTLSSIITIMLVCPRCGTSNLHNHRSLSIHLARYCTGPTFLSNALTTGTATSRSHDGRHPLSMATTSHQQARHFNAPEVNITLPTINTLHTMPSMSNLSSTQTDLAQSNVRYADFDDGDYSHNNDNHDFIPVHGIDDIII